MDDGREQGGPTLCAAGLEGNVLPGCQAARRGMDPNANVGYRSCLRAFVRLQLQLPWHYSLVQLPTFDPHGMGPRQAGARQVQRYLCVYIGPCRACRYVSACRLSTVILQHTLAGRLPLRWNVLHEKAAWLIGLEPGYQGYHGYLAPCGADLGHAHVCIVGVAVLSCACARYQQDCSSLAGFNHFISSSALRQSTVWGRLRLASRRL